MLNPTDNVIVTSFVVELNTTLEISTPLEFCIGKIVGFVEFNANVFDNISILLFPSVNFKSTSGKILLVLPSKIMSFGAEVYPLPKEVTSIDSNEDSGSTFTTWGIDTLGLKVKSVGKLNPILLIRVFLIFPIEVLDNSNIAPFPWNEFSDKTWGKE